MFCPKVHNKSVILAGVHRAVQRGRIMDLPGDWRDSGRRESLRRGVPRRNPGRQPDADGGEQDRGGPDDRPRDARVAPPAHGSRSWWGLVLGGEGRVRYRGQKGVTVCCTLEGDGVDLSRPRDPQKGDTNPDQEHT